MPLFTAVSAVSAETAETTETAEAGEPTDTFDAFSKPVTADTPSAPTAVSFEGGPEEPLLGAPVPPPSEEQQPDAEQEPQEPLVGETSHSGTAFTDEDPDEDEVSEPRLLTAQIVMEQIEVVRIVPQEP